MFKKPLGLLGVFLIIVGIGYFVGAGVAYSRVQGGYDSLQSFSEAQNVQLSYNEDGQLVDRGTVEGAQAIMSLLENDWGFPVVGGDMDPNDPLVNSASEYMFQMATIAYHTLNGTQTIVLTADDIANAIASEQLDADGTYNGVVEAYQGTVLEPGSYDVPVNGRYWTGFERGDLLDGPSRDLAWSGTAHALVAELGVGAATHSTLQLALGVAALLAGLGVVCTVSGAAFIWDTKKKMKVTAPDTIPEAMLADTPDSATQSA
ncbi:MAG: hypothetical protein E4H05_02060 [Acidimicrobiales bacterium]|nr:MAG: hypothetical protein E4H05_02060 [Acidimicrobiales bacterium]